MLDLFSHHIDHPCSDPQDFYPQLFQPYSQKETTFPNQTGLCIANLRDKIPTIDRIVLVLIKQPFWLLSSIGALKGAGLF